MHASTVGEALEHWDVARATSEATRAFYRAAPGGVPTQIAFSQDRRFDTLDLNRKTGTIRDQAHAFSQDGGLAVLFGNLAEEGCIVKTAGVEDSLQRFAGRARVFDSQDAAVEGILGGKVVPGDVVVIRYEGPCGGPGMQEMLYPTSYLKSKGLGKVCALITDGRFSGGSSGLSVCHVSPEAAEGGTIALVQDGDLIEFDIPKRRISACRGRRQTPDPSRATAYYWLAACGAAKTSCFRSIAHLRRHDNKRIERRGPAHLSERRLVFASRFPTQGSHLLGLYCWPRSFRARTAIAEAIHCSTSAAGDRRDGRANHLRKRVKRSGSRRSGSQCSNL